MAAYEIAKIVQTDDSPNHLRGDGLGVLRPT